MNAASVQRPPNGKRLLPSVSFSIYKRQLERLREIAQDRDVSVSRVARDALDAALANWDESTSGRRIDRRPAAVLEDPSFADSELEPAGYQRKLVGLPREFRRNAARGTAPRPGSDPAPPDLRLLQGNAHVENAGRDQGFRRK
jgi:hypothetical protein